MVNDENMSKIFDFISLNFCECELIVKFAAEHSQLFSCSLRLARSRQKRAVVLKSHVDVLPTQISRESTRRSICYSNLSQVLGCKEIQLLSLKHGFGTT